MTHWRRTSIFWLTALLLAACAAPSAQTGSMPLAGSPSPPSPSASPSPAPPSATPEPSATPGPTTTATPLACRGAGGQVLRDFIESDLLNLPLEFRVYLPPCYEEEPERRYPVLYLVHGQSYTQDQWDRLGVDETIDALSASGDLPPFIVVMPGDRVWTQPSDDMFGQALVNDLIPYIDATYRTRPVRDYRAIGGLSRGAAWALHLGLSRWELFGAIGLHSLPVFWDDVPRIRGWLAAIPPEELPRIYLDVGENDRREIKDSTFWFRDRLVEAGIPHEYSLFAGTHDEDYWASHVEKYLRFYAAVWGPD